MEITPVSGEPGAGGGGIDTYGADLGAGVLLPADAERIAERVRGFNVAEVGGPAWMRQHEALEKANLQAHANAAGNRDPFVMEAMLTFDKMSVLIHELMAVEAWREFVWPIVKPTVMKRNGLRVYYTFYHEATLVNLLEVFLYHDYACEAAGDALIDLVDYCARKISWLVSCGATPAEAKKTREEVVEEMKDAEGAAHSDMEARLLDIEYRCAVTAVSILRYITEHIAKLPLGVMGRVLDTHDVMLMMVPLIENPPWTRRTPEGVWQKFDEQKWNDVAPVDLLKLTKTEGQVWLILYNLMCDKDCRAKYYFHSSRKGGIMRLRKYMNDLLLDQLPPLSEVQRYLDELAIMDTPAPTAMAAAASGTLVLETVPVLRDTLLRGQDWEEVATHQLEHCFPPSGDAGDSDLHRLAQMYSDEGVADIIDPEGRGKADAAAEIAARLAAEGGGGGSGADEKKSEA